jgi:hypothetical protein
MLSNRALCTNCLRDWKPLAHSYSIDYFLMCGLKMYIPSTINTQMNLVLLMFWADWAISSLMKMSENLLKFEADFFNVLLTKQIQK